MAINEIKTKLTLDGVKDAVDGIKQIGTEGEAAAKKINGAFDNLKVGRNVTQAVDELKTAFASLAASSKTTISGFQNIASGAEKMARGIERGIKVIGLFSAAVGGVVGGAALLAKSSADTAEQIQNQADAFGISFDNMQKLRDAISAVGGDEGMLERALTKFTNAASSADDATDELGKKIKKFAGVTDSGLPGLLQYAKGLESLGTTQQQLAKVSADFGAKGATTLLAFLRQLTGEFDAATAAAEKIIPALDQIGQANLADLDTAGDKLGKNFSRLSLLVGSRIAPAFTALYDTIREIVGTVGPALANSLGEVALAIAEQITANKAEIIGFARDITASIIGVAADIRNALRGINSGDTTSWLVTLKNSAVGTFTFIRDTVNNVLIPAFKGLATALEPVAAAINGVFGTQYTGTSLAIIGIVGQLTGAFKVLSGAIELSWGALKIFFDWTINGKANVIALTGVLTTMFNVLKSAAIALVTFLAANPEIAVLVIGLGALAATIGYLATKQTEAEKTAAAHTEALRGLRDVQEQIKAGLPGATKALEDFKNEQLASADAAMKQAKANLALAQQRLDELVWQAGQNPRQRPFLNVQIEEATRQVRQQSQLLQQIQRNWSEIAVGIVDTEAEAKKLQATQAGVANQAARAANQTDRLAEGYKRIMVRGPNGFEKAFDVPTQKLIDAQLEVKRLADTLQTPTEGNTILDEAKAKADAFLTSIGAMTAQIEGALINLSAVASAQVSALVDALPNFFNGLPEAVAQAFGGVTVSIQSLWGAAMSAIIDQTRTMVDAVRGLIQGLQSTLISLAQSISRAQAAASGGGGQRRAMGGYIRGPGTGTSDSIPAWLSNGEFVIRAAAVRKYGADLFAALNGLRISPNLSGKFAMGGLVGLPAMPMAALPAAAGGPTSGLTLVLDNQSFSGLTGPADTLARLERAIKAKRIRSTGRPSPYER